MIMHKMKKLLIEILLIITKFRIEDDQKII